MTPSAPHASNGAVVWSRVDSDLSVATRDGDFAGYVDRRSLGTFLAFDPHGRHIGTFAHADAARSALGGHARDRRENPAVRGMQFLREVSRSATIARLFRAQS